jgi:hypothetical protein
MPTSFLRKTPKIYDGEKTASSTHVAGKSGNCLKKTETRSMPITCTTINSKWIKDLDIRSKMLKLVQERAGNTLKATGVGIEFLRRTPAAQQLRERMDKWDYVKLKSFCTTKKWSLNWRDHPQSGRKYSLAIHQKKD